MTTIISTPREVTAIVGADDARKLRLDRAVERYKNAYRYSIEVNNATVDKRKNGLRPNDGDLKQAKEELARARTELNTALDGWVTKAGMLLHKDLITTDIARHGWGKLAVVNEVLFGEKEFAAFKGSLPESWPVKRDVTGGSGVVVGERRDVPEGDRASMPEKFPLMDAHGYVDIAALKLLVRPSGESGPPWLHRLVRVMHQDQIWLLASNGWALTAVRVGALRVEIATSRLAQLDGVSKMEVIPELGTILGTTVEHLTTTTVPNLRDWAGRPMRFGAAMGNGDEDVEPGFILGMQMNKRLIAMAIAPIVQFPPSGGFPSKVTMGKAKAGDMLVLTGPMDSWRSYIMRRGIDDGAKETERFVP